jgi:hypothetical protein
MAADRPTLPTMSTSNDQRAAAHAKSSSRIAWLLATLAVILLQSCGDSAPRVVDVSPPISGRLSWAIAAKHFSYYATRAQLPCGIYFDAKPGFTGVASFVGTIGGRQGDSPSGRAFIVSPEAMAGDVYLYRFFLDGRASAAGRMKVTGTQEGGVLAVNEIEPDPPVAP